MARAKQWLVALCGFLSLPLAVLGQGLLDERAADGRTGGLLLGLATFLFLIAFGRRVLRNGCQPSPGAIRGDSLRNPLLAVVGAAASLGSYAFFGGNRLTFIGILFWQGGLLLMIGGTLGLDRIERLLRRRLDRWKEHSLRPSTSLIILALVTTVGALFRLWDIATLPGEPGVDLPLILLNVVKILDGEWPIFFTLHPGREGLYLYLVAGYVKLFGLSYPALRTVSTLVGTVTIPVLYLVGHQVLNRRVGLLAAGLLAVSRWHIILSRTGLRFIMMPLFSLLLIGALDRAFKRRGLQHWAAVGLVLGWGFHTYNAWWIMPAAVIGAWLLHQIAMPGNSRPSLVELAFALSIAALLLVPLLRFAHDDPGIFSLRILSRISNSERAMPAEVAQVAWTNMLRTIRMFNVTGDGVAHINVPLKRQLGLVSAALFLPGLAYLLVHWRSHATLLLTLICVCLPSALALAFPEEVPNAGRSGGAIGVACLVAAVSITLWRDPRCLLPTGWLGRPLAVKSTSAIAAMLLLAFFVVEGAESHADYFERYRFVQPGGNYAISTRLVEIILEYSPQREVFLKAFPHWYDGNALDTQLMLAGIDWDNELKEIQADRSPMVRSGDPFLVLLHPLDNASLYTLKAAFPHATQFTRYDNHNAPALVGVLVN
jgi:hypothetical protein